MGRCVYERAYVGQCAHEANGAVCLEHEAKKCWCGAQAVRECSIASSFVCGAPLCADHDCHHTAAGMTGSYGAKHSEKGYEQYRQWLKESCTHSETTASKSRSGNTIRETCDRCGKKWTYELVCMEDGE